VYAGSCRGITRSSGSANQGNDQVEKELEWIIECMFLKQLVNVEKVDSQQ
jgi:hypothetical protein